MIAIEVSLVIQRCGLRKGTTRTTNAFLTLLLLYGRWGSAGPDGELDVYRNDDIAHCTLRVSGGRETEPRGTSGFD